MTLPGEFVLRRSADVPVDTLVRLVRAYEEGSTGTAACTREDILLTISHPHYEDHSWCLTGPGHELLAWASLALGGGTDADAALTVRPGPRSAAAARFMILHLLDRTDALALARGTAFGLDVGGVLGGDTVLPHVLEETGFERGATITQYDVDLSRGMPPAPLPRGGHIRPAVPAEDADVLHDLHLRSRARGPKTHDPALFRARIRRLGELSGFALLMEIAGHPVGHVLAQAASGQGRILEAAVAPASRGLGVGLSLMAAALAELRRRQCVQALIAVDTAQLLDPEALHRALGVRGERAMTYFHREPEL
ncbi:GNAT family N-acetyltransferase [Streptomyces viridosporus]|uniref:GNAT family N-acetyltransferase n=1 Tax=Streptomyces viridosporus TaxID=67581 RepID=UPI0009BE107C|nr:GNAT family N-acetyltransferase [Streptomyces viridosporus]